MTLLEGIRAAARARGATVRYARGATLAGSGGSSAQLREAVTAARRSDVVVAVLGLDPRLEGEENDSALNPSGDRRALGLPASQEKLLEALVATGKPVIVVLTGGSALAVPFAAAHAAALLDAWYPGEEGGNAVADVLFGEVNPAGRLPITFYRSAADLPPFADYAMRGRTYRYLTQPPLYRFGDGLSYTTFGYANLRVAPDWKTISVDVDNRGARAGDEVVEVYVIPRDRPAYAPRLWLAAFARVSLARWRATDRFADDASGGSDAGRRAGTAAATHGDGRYRGRRHPAGSRRALRRRRPRPHDLGAPRKLTPSGRSR